MHALRRCHGLIVQVTQFIVEVIRAVVPFELWGSRHNQHLIFKHVGTFVRMTRYERMSVNLVVHGLRCMHHPG